MAFNLGETGRCEVFYVTCDDVKGDVQQPVYEAVRTRSAAFRLCAEKDKDILDQGSILDLKDTPRLYLYALIAAALDGRTKFTSPASRLDVEHAIKRRQRRNGKPMVFFLDEFPRLGSGVVPADVDAIRMPRKKKLRTMRNVFRSFSLPVVLSSTNGTARNIWDLEKYRSTFVVCGISVASSCIVGCRVWRVQMSGSAQEGSDAQSSAVCEDLSRVYQRKTWSGHNMVD